MSAVNDSNPEGPLLATLNRIAQHCANMEKNIMILTEKLSLRKTEESSTMEKMVTDVFRYDKNNLSRSFIMLMQGRAFPNTKGKPRYIRICLKCLWFWFSGPKRPEQCPKCKNNEFDEEFKDENRANEIRKLLKSFETFETESIQPPNTT